MVGSFLYKRSAGVLERGERKIRNRADESLLILNTLLGNTICWYIKMSPQLQIMKFVVSRLLSASIIFPVRI